MEIADYANEAPPSANLADLPAYVIGERVTAPIDVYRTSVSSLLTYGSPPRLVDHNFLGGLLAVGLISAAEGYVRGVLAACMELCPVAQTKAASQMINLGGLLWHGKSGFGRSAFEHSSFSSREELSKAYKNFIGFKLEDAVFKVPLDEFETVCQLRHGIVHGDGFLPGRNAVQLEIPRRDLPARIVMRYDQLQDVAAVINTLVFTLNRELFGEICKRWAIDWRRRDDWNTAVEQNLFSKIWATFHSSSERIHRRGRSNISRGKCQEKVRAVYGLT